MVSGMNGASLHVVLCVLHNLLSYTELLWSWPTKAVYALATDQGKGSDPRLANGR